jgi:ABC-type nickel/cobalt efflux system permease component RcnA
MVQMSLGTAIFLSAIMLSAVALYGLTMDRWNWKLALANVGRMLLLLGALILLVVIVNQIVDSHIEHGPWEDFQQAAPNAR